MRNLANGYFRAAELGKNSTSYRLPNGRVVSAETFERVLGLEEKNWSGRSLTKDTNEDEESLEERTEAEFDKDALLVDMPDNVETSLNKLGYQCDNPAYGNLLISATHRDTPDYQVIIMPQSGKNMETAKEILAASKAGAMPVIIFYGIGTDKDAANDVGAYAVNNIVELQKLMRDLPEEQKEQLLDTEDIEKVPDIVSAVAPARTYRHASPGSITRAIKVQVSRVQNALGGTAASIHYNQI